MKLLRNLGVQSQILNVFVQDASATSGAGLANVQGSSVSYSWWHDNQAAISTGTASTAMNMGTFTTSGWVQVSSSQALGWYQFGPPNGVFAAGKSAALHLYGATNMAPIPIEFDLDPQVDVVNIQGSNAATTSAGVLQCSTQALGTASVNVTQIQGANAVTTSAGVLQTSTQAMSSAVISSVSGSVASVLGTTNVNMIQIQGSNAVTSSAGTLTVSTQALSKTGYDVTSVFGTPFVTSAGGTLTVSTQTIDKTGYTVSTVQDKTGYALTAAYDPAKTASQAGDAMALTAAERATLAGVVLTTTQAEGFRASSSAGSLIQMQYEILANLIEASNSGTTRTLGSVTSHALGLLQYQYNSTTPSSITRIA